MRKVFRRSTAIAFSGLAVLGLAVFLVATATASTKHRTASVDVCVLLPDTKSSVRWETQDRKYLDQAFTAAGVPHTIVNAQGDPATQASQADQAITNGAKVILLVDQFLRGPGVGGALDGAELAGQEPVPLGQRLSGGMDIRQVVG